MKISKQLKGLAVGMALALGATTTAHAALIGPWDYYLEAGFTNTVYVPGDGTINETGDSGVLDLPTSLAWGVPSDAGGNPVVGPQSSLVLTPQPLTGTVNTQFGDDAASLVYAPGNTITYNNFYTTDDSGSLESATIQNRFTLDAATPPPPGSNTNQDPAFDIFFADTENLPDTNPPCPAPSGNTPATGCQDIFVLDLLSSSGVLDIIPSLTGPILVIDEYTIEDFEYQVLLRSTSGAGLAQLALLTSDQCAAAGAGPDCVGLLTQEEQANVLQLEVAIRAQELGVPVPAPGVLVLIGLGLLGMVGVRRQKTA